MLPIYLSSAAKGLEDKGIKVTKDVNLREDGAGDHFLRQ